MTTKTRWQTPKKWTWKRRIKFKWVSGRAGQTFEPDMEESGAPKKKEYAYLPTHTQKSWVEFGQAEIFLRMALENFE